MNECPLLGHQIYIWVDCFKYKMSKRTAVARSHVCGVEDSNLHGKFTLRLNVINYCHFTF